MEGTPYTPGLPESANSPDDKKTSVESSASKKRDKQTAQSVGETLFKADAKSETKPETTFWERLGVEKETEPLRSDAEEVVTLREALDEHIEERQVVVQAEQQQVDPNTPEAVAIAADAALLERSRQQFAQMSESAQPEVAVETAYSETAQVVDDAVAGASAEDLPSTEQTEALPLLSAEGGGSGEPPEVPPIEAHPPSPDEPERPRQPFQPEVYEAGNRSRATETVPAREAGARAAEAYRRGRSDGLFTGGLLGYLYGRRRGRKKAEKRLRPVFERLEKQLKQTTDKLTRREQDIRTLATRKIEQAPAPIQIKKVTERLTPPPSVETRPLPQSMAEAPLIVTTDQLPTRSPDEAQAAAHANELAVSRSEYAGVLPLNTATGEQLSDTELKSIAQKVMIDHVSLKEMYQAQRFDEKGLRRIVNEFLRGGDVEKAITIEVMRKDPAFELDRQLRQQATRALSGGSSSGPINGQYRDLPSQPALLSPTTAEVKPKRIPALGKQATQDLRRKQILSVAGVTVAVLAAIILTFVLTS
jgi:hypothetical protein